VKGAEAPPMPAGLLASLCSIPQNTELPAAPDNLAITADGQLVAIQRPDRVAGLRDSGVLGGAVPLGGSPALGSSATVLGGGRFGGVSRRAAQGAGVVVSGLVLSALALVVTSGNAGEVANGTGPKPQNANLLPAQFVAPAAPVVTSTVMTPPPAGVVGVRAGLARVR
jgi:hypothetical protein